MFDKEAFFLFLFFSLCHSRYWGQLVWIGVYISFDGKLGPGGAQGFEIII